MSRTKPVAAPMMARVYLRVSTDAQDLERQEAIITAAKAAGYYVAGIYREKASGARADRAELLRMIGDLQPGEVVVAEKIDRISRLPLPEAERLVASIRAQGARLAVPGVVDLSDLAAEAKGVSLIVEDSNAGARRLYERHGYTVRTARPMVPWSGGKAPGKDWLLMVKD